MSTVKLNATDSSTDYFPAKSPFKEHGNQILITLPRAEANGFFGDISYAIPQGLTTYHGCRLIGKTAHVPDKSQITLVFTFKSKSKEPK